MNNAGMKAELRRLNMKPEKTSDDSPNRSTIERFFSGLSEYIFQSKLGVADVCKRKRVAQRMRLVGVHGTDHHSHTNSTRRAVCAVV